MYGESSAEDAFRQQEYGAADRDPSRQKEAAQDDTFIWIARPAMTIALGASLRMTNVL